MGLLDDLLSSLTEGGLGQARPDPRSREPRSRDPRIGGDPGGGGMGNILMALLPVILSMLASRQGAGGLGAGRGSAASGGGLGDLLEQFRRQGYGTQAESWVGSGANQPISPDILAQVFGRDGLSRIATQAGLTEEDASAGLSELLPDVVDRMTPGGQMPDSDALLQSVRDLGRRLGV